MRGIRVEEPTEITGNDLEERLKTTRNRVDITLILLGLQRQDLIYTILEDLHYGTQLIMDKYCLKEELK